MPVLGTMGAMSARGFGVFSSIGPTGWIGILGSPSDDTGQAIAIDSTGNVYICGLSNDGGIYKIQLAKYNSSGAIQWQRYLGDGNTNLGYSIAVDSSSNVYVCGQSNTTGTWNFQIAKYNTSGAIQWQRNLGGSGVDYGYSIAIDSSNNVYVAGWSTSGWANGDLQIAKYNTSGVIQWQRNLGGSSSNLCYSISLDSSSNVYICGYSTKVAGNRNLLVAKYNTSGVIQWQRDLGGSFYDEEARGISVDSSGNVYICGYSVISGIKYLQIAKYNTSGVIQWQRSLGSGSVNTEGYSVVVDAANNIYVCGVSDNDVIQLAKYNLSGAIQWQRFLNRSGSTEVGYSISADAVGNFYICGISNASGSNNFIFAKLPGDGSKTGTYIVGGYSFTYASSSLTDAASTLTDVASSLTDAASSLTDAASSLTDAASTLTSSVTQI